MASPITLFHRIEVQSRRNTKHFHEMANMVSEDKYQINNNSTNYFDRSSDQIVDLIFKASSKREIETAEAGLDSICRIVDEYLMLGESVRNSIDLFIGRLYEKFKFISVLAFENNDTALLQALAKTYVILP
jgi:hypothetical protein